MDTGAKTKLKCLQTTLKFNKIKNQMFVKKRNRKVLKGICVLTSNLLTHNH